MDIPRGALLPEDVPAETVAELVRRGDNGWVLKGQALVTADDLAPLLQRADTIAAANHDWVAQHAMFGRSVAAFLARLQALGPRST